MNWKITQAKRKFSELVHSVLQEPQLIYNRDRLVAVVIEAEAYGEFLAWREVQNQASVANALTELRELCTEENYTLMVPPRQDRNNFFVEPNELPI
jgi:PHD/YefM family antitoxin component YafN of YafNO toxin-antitoxin module